METSDKCFAKIAEIRKELAGKVTIAPSRDDIDVLLLERIREMMNEKRIMIDSTVVSLYSYLVIDYAKDNHHYGTTRQLVSLTLSYTVIDVDTNDKYGPVCISTTTFDNLREISHSYDMNEWEALLTIFNLLR